MNYQQFVDEIKNQVAQLLGPNLNVEVMTTLKNNGQEFTGLSISDKTVNISPTIYLDEYYQYYLLDYPVESIAEDIANLYAEIKYEQNWDMDRILNFETLKPLIAYKLINADQNRDLLQKVPHQFFLDLAVTYYIYFAEEPLGPASILVTHDLMRHWEIDLETLDQAAHFNMPLLLPANFKPMHLAIAEMLKDSPLKELSEPNPLYVLTNNAGFWGASCILYKHMFENIWEQLGENYYILPSSIHEMVIVPESKSPSRFELNEMIQEINKTQLRADEILSNHAYFYDHSLKYMY